VVALEHAGPAAVPLEHAGPAVVALEHVGPAVVALEHGEPAVMALEHAGPAAGPSARPVGSERYEQPGVEVLENDELVAVAV